MSTVRTDPSGPGARHVRASQPLSPRASARAAPGLVLLALAGLAATTWVWLSTAREADGPAPPRSATTLPGVELASVSAGERTPASTEAAAVVGRAATDPADARTAARARPPRSEAEHLAAFLARGRATPGSLEATAAGILDGPGARAEKLALLAALRALDSPESLAWHEHAARSGPEAEPTPGLSLADAALQQLIAEAARSSEARAALARLAFVEPAPAAAARRRAAAGLARHADEAELARLGARLAHEPDELLITGVLGTVAEREPSAARTRLLLAHGQSDAPVPPRSE